VIRRKEHKWVGDIWNRSFRLLDDNERICFLHNDTIVNDDWLTELELGLDVTGCGCILPRQGNGTRARFAVVDDIRHLNGFCFMLSQTAIGKIGKFDQQFILKPDIDYFQRVLDNGMMIVVANKSNVEHVGGVTTGKQYSLSYYTKQVGKELNLIRDLR